MENQPLDSQLVDRVGKLEMTPAWIAKALQALSTQPDAVKWLVVRSAEDAKAIKYAQAVIESGK